MSLVDFVYFYILTGISLLVLFKSYRLISSESKFNLNIKNVFIILISTLLVVLNSIYNIYVNKVLISALILVLFLKMVYKDDWKKTIILGCLCLFIEIMIEFVTTIFLMRIEPIYINLNTNGLLKGLYTFFVSVIDLLLCNIRLTKKIFNVFLDLSNKKYIYIILIVIGILFIGFLTQKYSLEYNSQTYILNLSLLIIFILLMGIAFLNSIKIEREIKNKEVLIGFLTEYEKIIENDRINRHEMLNNLLILKSFDNKNTKKFNQILDDFINIYDVNNKDYIKNISRIPSGFKGIIYYKLNEMKNNQINLSVHISKSIKYSLDNLNYKDYVSVSKILGILLDNAYEASIKSTKKEVYIDVYEEDNKLYFIIDNSYNAKKVNINEFYKKNYSTKGKGRGLGLYVAKMLIKNSKNIELYQNADGKVFSSKLILK